MIWVDNNTKKVYYTSLIMDKGWFLNQGSSKEIVLTYKDTPQFSVVFDNYFLPSYSVILFFVFSKLDLFNTWGRGHTVYLKYSSPVVESALVDLWRQEQSKLPLTFLILQQNWPKSPFIKYCWKWPPGDTFQNDNFPQIKVWLENTLAQNPNISATFSSK